MRKVLVTGGAGFVGRHLIRRLVECGDEVHCVDPLVPLTGGLSPGPTWGLYDPTDFNNFHYHDVDCRVYFKRVRDTDFDLAFHLAAVVGGRLVIENNPLAVADDLAIDSEYWQWARATRPGKTICFSSSAAYPIKYQRQTGYVLLREDMIQFNDDIGMPDMSYGWAKLTQEYLARLAFEKDGLKSVIYRPFSGYGEDQDDTYPFPSICRRALHNPDRSRLTVWGTGDQMRDFIHIEDCIDGILTTMGRIDNAEAVNLSTGILTNFKEFARIAAAACGYTPEIVGTSDKPEGVFARGGDTAKQHQLGFRHQIDFETGVRRAIEYYAEREQV
jgi:nucleoside-diphosphate-sugar epimerase